MAFVTAQWLEQVLGTRVRNIVQMVMSHTRKFMKVPKEINRKMQALAPPEFSHKYPKWPMFERKHLLQTINLGIYWVLPNHCNSGNCEDQNWIPFTKRNRLL